MMGSPALLLTIDVSSGSSPQGSSFLFVAPGPLELSPIFSMWLIAEALLAPPGSSWLLLAPPRLLLASPGSSWLRYGSSWLLLAPLGSFWLLLAPPGSSWLLLAPPGSSWLLLAPPGSSWLLLASPGSSWLLLAPPGRPSRLLLILPQAPWNFPRPPYLQAPTKPSFSSRSLSLNQHFHVRSLYGIESPHKALGP